MNYGAAALILALLLTVLFISTRLYSRRRRGC
jgi:hypothetical protein